MMWYFRSDIQPGQYLSHNMFLEKPVIWFHDHATCASKMQLSLRLYAYDCTLTLTLIMRFRFGVPPDSRGDLELQ